MRVAVIGGGMAGLSAAHELLRRGADPVVFEAADRAGGKVGSRLEQGFLTEDGPLFIARPLDALLDAAGLRDQVEQPRGPKTRWVHYGARVLKAPSLPLLLRAGLGRALLEPLFARPLAGDPSLRAHLIQRLGNKAGELVAAVMAAGVYAGDPDHLSAREAFPFLAEPGSLLVNALGRKRPRIWSLQRGLGSFPQALAEKLEGRVRLGVAVSRLAPSWSVEGEPFEAVVLALPASRAAALARDFAPRFSQAAAQLRAAPLALVHLGFAEQALPRGFGVLDADGALHAVGTLLPSSMLPGRAPPGKALATAICGGARRPEIAALPEPQLIESVLGDLRRLFGILRDPEYARVVRHAEGIPQYAPGHRDRVRAAREALAELPRIELAGAAWDGVSVPDVVRSGAAAAARLVP